MSPVLVALVLLCTVIVYVGGALWFVSREINRRRVNRELRAWQRFLFAQLTEPAADVTRLEQLQLVQRLVDDRSGKLRSTTPPVRNSLENAIYICSMHPEFVRNQLGMSAVPEVDAITRHINRIDHEGRQQKK